MSKRSGRATSVYRHDVARRVLTCSALLCGVGCSAATEETTALRMTSEHGIFEGFFSTEPASPALGENILRVELSRHEAPVTKATLALDLWMDAHGHGGGGVPEASELGRGKYHIEHVVFPMPGRWSLGLDVKQASLEDRFDFTLDVH